MGRSNRGSNKKLDPEDVLSGRIRPSARELISLIHAVNPSGLELPARESQRRYASKSRLQSLLIRRFPDEISAAPDAERSEVVVLLHRPSGLDACHALVVELDEDARSVVRRMLDEQNAPGAKERAQQTRRPARAGAMRGSDLADVLAQGRAALEAFDYEKARDLLYLAARQGGDQPGSAVALLELLVDHLADDAAAVDLLAELTADTLREPQVRLLAGIAAARSGVRAVAVEMVEGMVTARAAEVHAYLARHSLEAGDLERARMDLDRTRELDAAHPEIEQLAVALGEARTQAQLALATRARELIDTGCDEDAWRVVKELLRESPGSSIGKSLFAELERRRAHARYSELVHRATCARESGDPVTALGLVREAASQQAPRSERERIARWMAELEAEVTARKDKERVEAIVAMLSEQPGEQAYSAYLDCRPEVRATIRGQGASRTLGWLDEVAKDAGPARNPAIAAAVDALVSAERLAARSPQAAIDRLAPHARFLAKLGEYRDVVERAQQGVATLRAQEAQAQLGEAIRAIEASDFETALERLSEPTIQDLPRQREKEARCLRERAANAIAVERRLRALESRARDPMPFDALALCEEMARCEQGPGLDRVQSIQRGIRARLHRAFRFHSSFVEVPLGCAPELVVGPRPQVWRALLSDGQTIVVPIPRGNWLFVAVADLTRRVYTRRAILRLPESLSHGTASICDDQLILMGREGGVLRLSTATLEPMAWGGLPLLPAVRSPDLVSSVKRLIRGGLPAVRVMLVAPGQRFLWVWEAEASSPRVRVIDLTTLRVVRDLPDLVVEFDMRGLPELTPPAVLVEKALASGGTWIGMYSPDGERLMQVELDAAQPMIGAHPEGSSLLMLEAAGAGASGGALPTRWRIREMEGDRSLFEMRDREVQYSPWFMVTDRAARTLYVLEATQSFDIALVALDVRPSGSLALRYRTAIPVQCTLCQPVAGGAVSALVARDDGLWPVAISGDAPSIQASSLGPPGKILEHFGLDHLCDVPTGALYSQASAALSRIRSAPTGMGGGAEIREALAHGDVDTVMTYVVALKLGHLNAQEGDLLRELRREHSQHPWVRVAHAQVNATLGQWTELLEWTNGVEPEQLDESVARHLYHLLAMAHLHLGHAEQARGALAKASLYEGRCHLLWWEAVATPAEQELRVLAPDPGPWPRELQTLRVVLRAVQIADERLANGDARGAYNVLDTVEVWQLTEVQSLARLAHAALIVDGDGAQDWLRTALILTSFLHCHADLSLKYRRELPLPEGRWEMARLDALAARVEAWMRERCP